jgi:hypothetical protein
MPHHNNNLVFFCAFFFLPETLWWELLPPPPYHSEHHVVWLEDLLDLLNNFDVPIHRGVWVMYFYFWPELANLQSSEVQTDEKCGMTVLHIFGRK